MIGKRANFSLCFSIDTSRAILNVKEREYAIY
ncbi:hypothetical protein DesyoDRAFT_4756 [Desulfosporosinus youngiae DSM 17734]|uniref:Uncharacterized protein n=1 Tax=Desulfosporosinus youngiae DSM 17734 TaxID=768710 RepID=H5XYZ4_9FIRM|nr:hypothetical protein DesyoDRAFT_4756 [Desulfosporosinus youngiae DSM 17734]